MRTLIYARVSQDPRGEGRSVTEQEQECRAWADREGWDVVQVIAETGSASRFARSTGARSRWAEVTTALTAGGVDALLVWEASRATRDLTAYTALRDLCAAAGVRLGYSGTLYDLTDRSDRFRTGLDALISEDESARTSERILRTVRARATAGQPHGKIPYGYRRTYDPTTGALLAQVPDEATAPVVAEIVARIINRESTRSIANDLTRRGVTPPRPPRAEHRHPRQWLSSTVQRIATNPANAALRVHQGVIVGPAAWPAIITTDQLAIATGILSDPSRASYRGDRTARWLLSGIALCGLCDRPMSVLTNRGRRTYACTNPGCMRVARVADPVDAHVTAVVLALLAQHRDRFAATDQDATNPAVDTARADLTALRARLDQLVDQGADGAITPATLARLETRLTPRIVTAERHLRTLLVPAALDDLDLTDPATAWEARTVEEQRRILRALIRVRVMPAGKGHRIFDPTLIEITPAN